MPIMEHFLPNSKSFFAKIDMPESVRQTLTRFMLAMLTRHGRNSSMNAAGVIKGRARHRAQPGRFLQRRRWRRMNFIGELRTRLLGESALGESLLIVDSTMTSQQGEKTENTFSTGNRKRRPQKGRRYSKYKHARRSCHCFVFGLWLTPTGERIPFMKPYYTPSYAKRLNVEHRTQAELAAEIVNELPVPKGASVTVIGDTAFDAKIMRHACDSRGFVWIFPCNANRVFQGPRGRRPRVSSRIKQLSNKDFQVIRVSPGSGKYVPQRRLSAHRVGSKSKQRTYYVHSEERDVRSVGQVTLVFSSTKPIEKKASRNSTKILMTNATSLTAREIVELYGLRWQIELFFKELKSVLGMHQYRYRRFNAVEAWIEIVLITFIYLEWTRKRRLEDKRLTSESRRIWKNQRAYGIRQAVLTGIEIREQRWIVNRLKSRSGTKVLAKTFTQLLAYEYRCTV